MKKIVSLTLLLSAVVVPTALFFPVAQYTPLPELDHACIGMMFWCVLIELGLIAAGFAVLDSQS